MSLSELWFGIFVLIIAGYLILDGFDFGVGIVHLVVARTDEQRRMVLNSIGPVWDGNEVWIVLGGGVLFAAFPPVYASLFSGFYLAFVLVLMVMILRTVAIEFRSKKPSPAWRRLWDCVFAGASIAMAFLLGVAFGNILSGVELDENGNIHESLIDLLNPFALLIGVTGVAMFAVHGLLFLAVKTTGELEERVRRYTPLALIVFFVLVNATVIDNALTQDEIRDVYLDEYWPLVFPAAAFVSFVACLLLIRATKDFHAFLASAVVIALLLISGAVGMWPNLLISSTNEQYNLTVHNSAAADNTLEVMLAVALLGMPLVLLYTAGIYYFFRGKVELGPDSY